MKTFLEHCAEDIYLRYADRLNEVCIVFPNNRAKLFFEEALSLKADRAIWAPQFSSISDLFAHHCSLEQGDPLLLNSLLYKVYQEQGLEKESFDEFYPWGNILLRDFDNIDKNLADAKQLFRNIGELAEYTDDFSYLTPEQIEVIQGFFAHFDTDRSELKKRFVRLWNCLFDIYDGLREALAAQDLAYEGMIQRQVVEDFDRRRQENAEEHFPAQHYLFVGFNALSACEKTMFIKLQKMDKAHFYWDYDPYYLHHPGHEAGHFIRENLKLFPNELHESCFDNWQKIPKKIRFISSSSEHAQVHYAGDWIEQYLDTGSRSAETTYAARDTAIILCNENLLPGVLQCIPPHVQDLNVTMGYPVRQTTIYTLLRQILLLHSDNRGKQHFRSRFVLPLLQNPYIRQISSAASGLEKELRTHNRLYPDCRELQQDEFLSLLFRPVQTALELGELLLDLFSRLSRSIEDSTDENNEVFLPLFQEALFKCYTQVNRLNGLMQNGMPEINMPTYKKLLLQVLDLSVPFSGEPLRGMQIMGMLETRCLDFKNILMLSVSEGQLPKNRAETSFIPYNLRRAFNLSGPEHQDAIAAYYFFRILQRAENIGLVYNSATDGMNRGEMSRFMLQLSMESGLPIEILHLNSAINIQEPSPICIPKTPELMQKLYEMYDHNSGNTGQPAYMSPSMLNTYMDCSLKYYFKYILRLKKEEELSEQMDPSCFGTIFHHAAQHMYIGLILGKNGQRHEFEDILHIKENIADFNRQLAAEDGHLDRSISADELETLGKRQDYLQSLIDYYMKQEFFRLRSDQPLPPYNGEQQIQRKLLRQFLQFLIRLDKDRAPFELLGLETKVDDYLDIETAPGRIVKLRIGGVIDRLDKTSEGLRICDYKTGGKAQEPNFDQNLFISEEDRSGHVFQTLLYAGIVQNKYPGRRIKPELLYIHKAGQSGYSPDINIIFPQSLDPASNKQILTDYSDLKECFDNNLLEVILSLFDPEQDFVQTQQSKRCSYCDFKHICRRD